MITGSLIPHVRDPTGLLPVAPRGIDQLNPTPHTLSNHLNEPPVAVQDQYRPVQVTCTMHEVYLE